MLASRLVVALALAPGLLAACGDADGPGPGIDASPLIQGTWTITRTVRTQPADCRELHPGPITATFTVGGAVPITIEGSSLKEWSQEVTADSASFVTEDFAFPMESFRPVLISHELHWANSQLIGTGGAQGDGDDLGCSWAIELVGIVDFSP